MASMKGIAQETAADPEKFQKWAETVPATVGNPSIPLDSS